MFKVSQLTQWCDGSVANGDEPKVANLLSSLDLQGVAPLNAAQANQVAFFFSKNYQNELMSTRAGVIVTGKAFLEPLKQALPQWKSSVIVACDDPYLGMAKVLAEVSKFASSHDHQLSERAPEIHPTAFVDPSAKIEEGVVIYPFCYVGKDCVVGKGTVLFPRVTLYERTRIGERCRIHAGAVIGSDGFGYAPVMDAQTKLPIRHQKIYHVGGVVIGSDVEVGANTTVDRGTIGDTVIGNQVKLDNLVQIAHNCNIGEGSIFCGAAAMAGSSSSGKFVYVGGHSGAGNQIHIGDYSKLGAYSGLGKDSEPHSEMAGIPARPLSEHYRILALQQKLLRERGRKK